MSYNSSIEKLQLAIMPALSENPTIDEQILHSLGCEKIKRDNIKRLSEIAKMYFPNEYRINPGQKFLLKLEAIMHVADRVGGFWNRIKSALVSAFYFLVYDICKSYDSRYYPRPEKYPFRDFEDMQFYEQYKKALIKQMMDEQ